MARIIKSGLIQMSLPKTEGEGSIEERWKATRAYSSIVGKRMDPAILSMNYNNEYNLHIYPIPAHGSRKVTKITTSIICRLLWNATPPDSP